MISYDGYSVGSSSKVVSPLFQCMKDGKEFPVIDVVVLSGWGEHLRVIYTGAQVSIGIFLY